MMNLLHLRLASGFSLSLLLLLLTASPAAQAQTTIQVTTTADNEIEGDGQCTLREAIKNANTNAGLDTVAFAIAGEGPHVIEPGSALPTITETVVIDGSTQPGNEAVCMSAIDKRDPYQIILDGGGGTFDGLDLVSGASHSVIRGLNIRNFGGNGIAIRKTTTARPGNLMIACNFIGTDEQGEGAQGNTGVGVFVQDGYNNTIGGLDIGDGNLISGNGSHGVQLDGGSAQDNTVQGNLIGTDRTGSESLGNARNGVYLRNGSFNLIGGTEPGAGNTIAFNTRDGVALGGGGSAIENQIVGNAIFENGQQGIDVGNDGPTPNDPDDEDTGANNLQNAPELISAGMDSSGEVTLRYVVDTDTAHASYPLRVEFFTA